MEDHKDEASLNQHQKNGDNDRTDMQVDDS